MYTCSLDAEKCFDKLWHSALLYKLWGKIPLSHWLLLYKWYAQLKCTIKWNGNFSRVFNVSRGTRQGSILSPLIFNIFIDDLLKQLHSNNNGVRIGGFKCNSFAYADDITLICTTVTGLQTLIDICADYSSRWRFNFGIKKTKCMIYGKNVF